MQGKYVLPPPFRTKEPKIAAPLILSYMTLGTAKTWRDYVISLMYRQQHNFSSGDELLQKIDWKFGNTDKHTTQSLKIQTMQQGDKPMDEHVQDVEKAMLEASYDGYLLDVEFKEILEPRTLEASD